MKVRVDDKQFIAIAASSRPNKEVASIWCLYQIPCRGCTPSVLRGAPAVRLGFASLLNANLVQAEELTEEEKMFKAERAGGNYGLGTKEVQVGTL